MIGISAVEGCRKVVGRHRRPLRVGDKGRHGCRNVKVMTTSMISLFFIYSLSLSPIYPSPLVYWLCHTFVVYQLDSSLIRAKASPLPLSLVLFFGLCRLLWASLPFPLAASSPLFHLLWSSCFFIHLSMPWAQIPLDHLTIASHAQTLNHGPICSTQVQT